jgi:hypothetical protein
MTGDDPRAWSEDAEARAAELSVSAMLERLPELPLVEPGGRRVGSRLPDDFEALAFARRMPPIPVANLPAWTAPSELTARLETMLGIELGDGASQRRILRFRAPVFAAIVAACLLLGLHLATSLGDAWSTPPAPRLILVDVEAPTASWLDPTLIMLQAAGKVVVR